MTVEQSQAPAGGPLIPLHCLRHAEPGPPRLAALPTGTPVWVVTRHADVRQALTDPRLDRASLYAPGAPPVTVIPNILDAPDTLLNIDGPEHQALRRTVQRAFTPRAIERWRPWVASVVEDLIDGLAASGSPADVVAAFSRPLPVQVICRLMGLDHNELTKLADWSEHALSATAYTAEEIQQAMQEFGAFGYQLVLERRKNPGDDLVSSLVLAADETGGASEIQLTMLVIGLVLAGHETTMTTLGNAIVYLLDEDREAWARIGADQEAAVQATEQALRTIPLGDNLTGPGLLRRANADLEIGGVTIPAGSIVAADAGTANHDPEVYPPGIDLFAPLGTPSLTFGAGPHHCLGAWLARMELELGLHGLARRFPELRLTEPTTDISWRTGLMTRSPLSLQVAW
ncbi:Cytochrome P450 [Kitasatospora sp. MMS16-BH015]|uniref:cytochrome P450 n=1 Tax=Kitasatospora sp. MMS16-BH015 TaxID=2018025 RepID=UPI000CA3C99D|nr:cytochrome P450 [Kitasatospora sp. MMS16-BH015]AUG75117.1 Cytochrome P450 [Kitasatospora sp. MMS16-BH015]